MSIFLGAYLRGESREQVERIAAALPEGALAAPEHAPHVTFAYVGDEVATQDAMRTALVAGVAEMAAWRAGLIVTVTGWARFLATDEGMDALVLLVDNWRLPFYFLDANRAVEWTRQTTPNHGFIPHVTLGYLPSSAPTPEIAFAPFELTLDALTLSLDGEEIELPLMEAVKAAGGGGLTVTKDAAGTLWWVGLSSSDLEDRDGEIVTKAALEAAVARGDEGAGFGALNWWHEETLEIGTIEWSAVVGGHLMQAGRFSDPAVGKAMLAAADDLAFSIEFVHPAGERDAEGCYHDITLTGCALLPRGKESNRFTALRGNKEARMGVIEQKLRQLAELTGDEGMVAGVLDSAIAKRREALAAGVRRKEAGDGATGENPQSEGDGETPAPADNAPDGAIIGTEGAEGAAKPPAPTAERITALFATPQAREAMAAAAGEAVATQATKEQALRTELTAALTTIKEQGDALAALTEQVATLTGEMPRGQRKAMGWFQASEADETVVAKGASAKADDEGDEGLFAFADGLLGLSGDGPPA